MESFLIFIVVLGVLIFFHELGHFLVARLCGVGVETFALGFGPRIFGKTIGRTDYRIAAIPLGGYVKMVGDEPNAPIDPEDMPLSFNHKHVAKRSMIAAAGPCFNILLAFFLFAMIFYFSGMPGLRPIVRSVEDNSPAAQIGIQQGDLIHAVNHQEISVWQDMLAVIDKSHGQPLTITIDRQGQLVDFEITPRPVSVKNMLGDEVITYDIGLSPFAESRAIVDGVADNTPAQKAGLQKDDLIVAIDDQPIERFQDMQQIVADSKGKTLLFRIQREQEILDMQITPVLVKDHNLIGIKQSNYRIGIYARREPIPAQDQITVELGLFQSLWQGIYQTWYIAKLSVYYFAKMIQGKVSMETLGGPIRIAQMAREQAHEGLVRFINFMAAISVQLAILNLLPIPVLDGGHLLFFSIEAIRRRPVSRRMREIAQQIGIFFLILLMIFVFYNDIMLTFFK